MTLLTTHLRIVSQPETKHAPREMCSKNLFGNCDNDFSAESVTVRLGLGTISGSTFWGAVRPIVGPPRSGPNYKLAPMSPVSAR